MTGSPAGLGDPRITGVSLGHRDLAEADHWILALDPRPVLANTHLVTVPFRHVAITLAGSFETAPELRPGADAALADAYGRAVLFPGVADLVGTLSVAELLSRSAVARVEVLGGAAADDSAPVDTGDFVRPRWRDGALVLTVMPAAGGKLVPFETRHPTPCCAAH